MRHCHSPRHAQLFGCYAVMAILLLMLNPAIAQTKMGTSPANYELNDDHFHLTNYIQEGTDIHKFLEIMGTRVGRVALFGLPLQQMWSYQNSGDFAPTYYLASDAPLYYYSFTDAYIAMAYKSLSKEQQARMDPMITGFNPADMYAADHIRRVLTVFPGVFTGIGEFSIHKEFVSSKISGEVASLTNPALGRILDLAAEAGLVVILHNDVNMPFPKSGQEPYVVKQLGALLRRHRDAEVIWAHCGLGRVVQPVPDQIRLLEHALADSTLKHIYIDLSWTETAKYFVGSPEALKASADLINKYPERFLFGTDEVAPSDQKGSLKIYDLYAPLLAQLTKETREKFLKGNYEKIFDEGRRRVRAWEKANANRPPVVVEPTPISGVG
jgi:predicted TIM-barrel fold metal-dependent hydrolase